MPDIHFTLCQHITNIAICETSLYQIRPVTYNNYTIYLYKEPSKNIRNYSIVISIRDCTICSVQLQREGQEGEVLHLGGALGQEVLEELLSLPLFCKILLRRRLQEQGGKNGGYAERKTIIHIASQNIIS